MIAHSKKRQACFCGTCKAPVSEADFAFWGECRSCRVAALRNRKGHGTPNPATPKTEVVYNGSIKGGEW